MNLYEENGDGTYSNHGAILCSISLKFIGSEHEFKNESDHLCEKCKDKINLDDKYHNETYNLRLFKPNKMKFIDILNRSK